MYGGGSGVASVVIVDVDAVAVVLATVLRS